MKELLHHFRRLGVSLIEPGSVLEEIAGDENLCRGWTVAMERALRRWSLVPEWARERSIALARTARDGDEGLDESRAYAAELEAGLRLGWIGDVEPIPRAKRPTPDFLLDGILFEVYCPVEHREERKVVRALLSPHENSDGVQVTTAISHPHIGSGRRVDDDGVVRRSPGSRALSYPANKLMDRILNAKRRGAQFVAGTVNVLWLDLKHGLGMSATDCLPFRSIVAKGTCFVGTHGVWHAFYGAEGAPLFHERSALEFSFPAGTYQQSRDGWFRSVPDAGAAVLSTTSGVVLFENPWSSCPVPAGLRDRLLHLSELRPDYSWTNPTGALMSGVESALDTISYLARNGTSVV